MNADQLLQWLTNALFVAVFIVAVCGAIRHPAPANVDTALLFGAAAVIVGLSWAAQMFDIAPNLASIAVGGLGMALPYLLLRLLNHFMGVPRIIMRLAEIGLACAILALVVERPLPGWIAVLLAGYFLGLELYAALRFLRGAHRSRGVTRRRMEAVAIASGFLGLTVVLAGLEVVVPEFAGAWTGLSLVTSLASGIGYFLGFATPGLLRRAWQEPEVRAFLRSAASLPQLRDTPAIVRTLENSVAESLGARYTAIGLWEDGERALRFYSTVPAAETAVLEVPIAAGETRLGVLVAHGRRAVAFADEDMELARLLANQVALALGYARELKERERVEAEIAERRRAERALRESEARLERRVLERTAQLEDAIKELESFSYTVSHDLRAPLRALSGFSRILLEEHAPQLGPEAQGYLQTVSENAQQMGRLIDDLLAFSRLGRQPMKTQRVLPADIVQSALDQLAPELEGRELELNIRELEPCQADPVLLRQVYINLLSNALKYTRRRDVAHIEVGSTRTDGEVVYFVKDNGAGFDMRYADKLFGVFQRLHRMEDYAGTGVGLAIVQRIIHRHGGRIWAQAAPDQGAAFFFTIRGDAVRAPLEGSAGASARAA